MLAALEREAEEEGEQEEEEEGGRRKEGWRGAGGKRDRSVLESPESGGWTLA